MNEKIADSQEKRKQPEMSEQEKMKLAVLKKEKRELVKDLKKGILTAGEYREVDFWEKIPEIKTLEYRRVFLLGGIII